jgi:Holliday junction resolvase RusA-like endonuclease
MARFRIPIPCPSKANNYEIHFDRQFWGVIRQYVEGMRKYTKKPLYWISPSKAIKETERAIAFAAKRILDEDIEGPVWLKLWVSDKIDADNALKAVCDGIEQSGRIKNDKQVKQITVNKFPGPNNHFDLDIGKMEEWPLPDEDVPRAFF